MGLFTLRDILPGEELTYNYNFHSFNAQQSCLCGAQNCRGRIGDKSGADKPPTPKTQPSANNGNFRALSHRERQIVNKTAVFLLRNYDKTRRRTLQTQQLEFAKSTPTQSTSGCGNNFEVSQLIAAQLTALRTARSMRTRRLATAAQSKQLTKLARLAQVLNHLYQSVMESKMPDGSRALSIETTKKASFTPTLSNMKEVIISGHYSSPLAFNTDMLSLLDKAKSQSGKEAIELASNRFEKAKQDSLEQLRDILGFDVTGFVESKTTPTTAKSAGSSASEDLLTTMTDLSYVEDGRVPVGSYDPDLPPPNLWRRGAEEEEDEDDKVRCPCGVQEEEGTMLQCDVCLYWEHADCVGGAGEGEKHECWFCREKTDRVPSVDVLHTPQPQLRLPGCLYYRSLTSSLGLQVCKPNKTSRNTACPLPYCSFERLKHRPIHGNEFQMRVGECVYVKKMIDDKHKEALKRLHEECVEPMKTGGSPKGGKKKEKPPLAPSLQRPRRPLPPSSTNTTYSRSQLRIFRVERLFTGPNNEAFLFGWYYARPHETFCEPTRKFYKRELFCTPLYDTLPLDAAVARCLVLDPQTYCKGRPKLPNYREQDVYICELRVDKSQRFFEKPFIYPDQQSTCSSAAFSTSRSVEEEIEDEQTPLGVIKTKLLDKRRVEKNSQLERIIGKLHNLEWGR